MRLQDTVAVVTGAAAGLGEQFVRAFVDEGASVVAVDKAADRLADTVADIHGPGTVHAATADVRVPDDIDDVVETTREVFGGIDLLVNNAGVKQLTLTGEPGHRVQDIPIDLWDAVIDTNLRGPFLFTRAVLPELLAADDGRIIHVTSGHGQHGRVGRAPYVASKHALEGLHRTLALEVADTGVESLLFTPPDGGVRTREAQFVDDPSSMSHEPTVVREPMVRLAAGEGRNGGRYRGLADGEGYEETDLMLD
jgi:3-oxoacyl-[acyl-carrier protein] reductase